MRICLKKAFDKFQCVPTTYPTENKEENYLEIYIFLCIMPIVFTSFKHPKLPISSKIPATLLQIFSYLHGNYISKFEFMNNLFANLLVAWLYMFLHSSVQKQRIPINGDCSNLTIATQDALS